METEKSIERYLVKKVNELNGKIYKLESCQLNGLPDRMTLYKGQCIFVELKKPNGKLSRLQEHRIKQIKEQGFKCLVINSKRKVDELIYDITQISKKSS
jgi:hypothetical protein